MKRLLKKLTLATGVFMMLLAPLAAPAVAHAATSSSFCEGANLQLGDSDCTKGDPAKSVNSIIATVINVLSLVVGVASVIMIIIGGLRYVTSAGDSNSVNGAKNTILYAIIGLVVVVMAQVIVQFVLVKATPQTPGSTLTNGGASSGAGNGLNGNTGIQKAP